MKVTKEEFYEWMNGNEDGILRELDELESRWRLLAFRVLMCDSSSMEKTTCV